MAKRQGIMLCYPFEEKRLNKWKPPYLVQPKYDGERCRAIWSEELNKWRLISSELNEFVSVPHLSKAIDDAGIPRNLEIDGELYNHEIHKIGGFSSIHSIVSRTVNLHPEYNQMQFHVFDLVENTPQFERIRSLVNFQSTDHIIIAPTVAAVDLYQIMKAYDLYVGQDYEGIIVRHVDNLYVRKRSTFMMKFKPKKDDWYRVIGYKEEISKDGKPKGRLGALICTGDDGTVFSVGSGLTERDRIDLWDSKDSLSGKLCHVQYQHITSGKGVPRFPVFITVEDGGEFKDEIKDFNPLIGGDKS